MSTRIPRIRMIWVGLTATSLITAALKPTAAQDLPDGIMRRASIDLSTLTGALESFDDAVQKQDAARMTQFYRADGDAAGRLALVNANRILSALALKQAITLHIDKSGEGKLVEGFNLLSELDQPSQNRLNENGDVAMTSTEGAEPKAVWFKKLGGVWKQDISPTPPATVADSIQDMEDDTAAVRRITGEVEHQELKTLNELRDALDSAMLNAAADEVFHARLSEFAKQHERPDPHGVFPMSPATPAGTMNRYLHAMASNDEPMLRDCVEFANDADGSARAAVAHSAVVGYQFLLAVERRFPRGDGFDGMYPWPGVIARYMIQDYTDSAWIIDPKRPDVAESSNEEIVTTTPSPAGPTTVHTQVWTTLMHRGVDGNWRIGLPHPLNAHQIQRRTAAQAEKDRILKQATRDLGAGKFQTLGDVAEAVIPPIYMLPFRLNPVASN